MDVKTLVKANIRYKKGSFISVLVLTFIITLCLTTIISINHNIEKRAFKAHQQVNTGDLTVFIDELQFSDNMLEMIENNSLVDKVEIIPTISQHLEINDISENSSTFFMEYNSDQNPYRIYSKNGLSFIDEPEDLNSGEIYAPIDFKTIYNCKIGDTAYIYYNNTVKEFKIKGFFEEPLLGSTMIGIKAALMNKEDFQDLYSARAKSIGERASIQSYHFVKLFQEENSNVRMSDFKNSINKDSKIIDYAFLSVSKDQSVEATLIFTQIFGGIMAVFLLLLIVVVLIVIGHSISTGIEMDYKNFGVMKAIGFSHKKLRLVILFEYMLAEFIGIILGLICSIPAIHYLNSVFVSITGLLSDSSIALLACFKFIIGIIILSILYIHLKTRKIIKISPVRAISGGRNDVYFSSRLQLPIEGKGLRFKLAFRQLTSGFKQYISSIIIIAFLSFFLISVTDLAGNANINTLEESLGIVVSDFLVYYRTNDDNEIDSFLQENVEEDIVSISPIVNTYVIGGMYFTVNGDELNFKIYDNPSDVKGIIKGREPIYDNEIMVTEIVVKELGIDMGDTVTIGFEDQEEDFVISGIFQSINDLGRTCNISFEGAKRLIPNLNYGFIEYKIKDSHKTKEIIELIKQNHGDDIEVIDYSNDSFDDVLISALCIIETAIYIISIIFAYVVVVIVCGKIFLKERIDYGIYKAIGFSTKSLRIQFSLRFAIVALLGCGMGSLANICFNDSLMSSLLGNVGLTNYESSLSITSYVLPTVILTTCFFVFSYLLSGRIKKIDTRQLICDN